MAQRITREWLLRSTEGAFALTPENVAIARSILTAGWRARALERGLPAPRDLEGACKFASLLVKLAFGGRIEGAWTHQYNVIAGQTIDLTGQSCDAGHDLVFFGNREHLASMESCLPRVQTWLSALEAQLTTA
ncbi:hypothetical protein ACOTHJ_15435 [Achromobacter xylosoxidans]